VTQIESGLLVVDVSVAAKWYLDDETHTDQARALAVRFRSGEVSFVVPDCFFYEFVGLVRRAERRNPPRLDFERSGEIVAEVAGLPVQVIDCRSVLSRALEMSRTLDIATYDALYIAAAESMAANFVTADERLYERIKHLSFTRWIGDL
jgi:predicted nucleic acid-binding protein